MKHEQSEYKDNRMISTTTNLLYKYHYIYILMLFSHEKELHMMMSG